MKTLQTVLTTLGVVCSLLSALVVWLAFHVDLGLSGAGQLLIAWWVMGLAYGLTTAALVAFVVDRRRCHCPHATPIAPS